MVIVSHNYGRYLDDAIDSVLHQTHPPTEVLVVDDGSTDDTRAVAEWYADKGVRYMRVDGVGAWAARKAGYENTRASCLCFLDADDTLHSGYLEQAARVLKDDWRVGVIYTDLFRFGVENGVRNVVEGDINRANHIHAGSVVRRVALITSRAFEQQPTSDRFVQNDWVLWRKVLNFGWLAKKSGGVYNYRRHGETQSNGDLNPQTTPWPTLADVYKDRISILLPLSGRYWAWPHTRDYLERQTWPHEQIELIVGDTSQDDEFGDMVQGWLVDSDYNDFSYVKFPVARVGLADEDRKRLMGVSDEVNIAMCTIWQRLASRASSPWVWTLEDDMTPPDDVAALLLRRFTRGVDAVCSPYKSRFENKYATKRMNGDYPKRAGRGVEQVSSTGFGCLLIRTAVLRAHTWAPAGPGGRWYDPWFFESTGKHLLCDWDCPSDHLNAPSVSNEKAKPRYTRGVEPE